MKKIISLSLVFVLLTLCSCSTGGGSDEDTKKSAGTCVVSIDCRTINENMSDLEKSKIGFVPENGMILSETETEIFEGDSAIDVIVRACEKNHCEENCKYCSSGIQIEYTYTAAYDSYYIEGVHQIYEKDCGAMSGWLYSVNGEFPNVGSSAFAVKDGDVIVLTYSCDGVPD